MKRICSTEENQLIGNHVSSLFTGSLALTKSNDRKLQILLGAIFGIIGMVVTILFILFTVGTQTSDSSSTTTSFTVFVVFFFSSIGVALSRVISRKRGVKTGNQEFIAQGIHSINGGTVVGFDTHKKVVYYIEDDFLGPNGLPIIIDYPANQKDFQSICVGERIIILYHADDSFQLMHTNPYTCFLVPGCSPYYPLTQDPRFYVHLPHPNAAQAAFVPRPITAEETNELIENTFRGNRQKNQKRVLISTLCIDILFMVIAVLLYIADGFPALIAILIFMAMITLLLCLTIPLSEYRTKRNLRNIQTVQEVIFCSFGSEIGFSIQANTNIQVYQWSNGSFKTITHAYPYMEKDMKNCKYGDIIQLMNGPKLNQPIFCLRKPFTAPIEERQIS